MSDASHKNLFREDSQSHAVFAYIQKKQVVTKKELLAQKFSYFDVTRILTPRSPDDCKGECRGHPATFGWAYYMERLPGKKFRLRWRSTPLQPLRMDSRVKVSAEKKNVVTQDETKTLIKT